jgi:hypothetical protein
LKKRTDGIVHGILTVILLLSFLSASNAQEIKHKSFSEQNAKRNYTSIAFGMGASYGNNNSLKTYIGYELPGYNYLTDQQKLKDLGPGFDFFLTAERQVHRNYSIKADYSYFIKSNGLSGLYPDYSFNYTSHRIFLIANYIIPMEYSYFKFGIGGGGIFSSLSNKFSSLESVYTSKGIGVKAEGVFDLQMGNTFAGYISGYLLNVFDSGLKDENGVEVLNRAGGKVNLSSFSAGVRIGVEIFIF